MAVVRVDLRLACSWGRPYDLAWTGRDGVTGTFDRDGERLRIRDRWEEPPDADGDVLRGSVVVDAEVVGESRAAGRADAELRWSHAGTGMSRGSCYVRDVTFRAREE